MYRIRLDEQQRAELQRRTRDPHIKPRTRDRLEMVRLLDAGMRVPEIARVLQVSPRRVRVWLTRFREGGFDALPDQPHLGRPGRFTPEVRALIGAEFAKGDRTWTASQLAEWLETEHEVKFSVSHLRELLSAAGFSSRRTETSLAHQQQPAQVAACRAQLAELEKGALPVAWTSAMSTKRVSL